MRATCTRSMKLGWRCTSDDSGCSMIHTQPRKAMNKTRRICRLTIAFASSMRGLESSPRGILLLLFARSRIRPHPCWTWRCVHVESALDKPGSQAQCFQKTNRRGKIFQGEHGFPVVHSSMKARGSHSLCHTLHANSSTKSMSLVTSITRKSFLRTTMMFGSDDCATMLVAFLCCVPWPFTGKQFRLLAML